MELDITQFVNEECPMDYQASRAEIGQNAGQDTWNAALECDLSFVTDENRQEIIDYFTDMGFSESGDMNNWPDAEINALVIQEISSQIREYSDDPVSEWDWDDYQVQSDVGQISGRLFKADDGKIYCYIGG